MNTINREKILIALWFAIAGFIPAVALFRSFSLFTVESYFAYLVLPVLCAGMSGYTMGYRILHQTTTGKQAALRILSVALIPYAGLVFAITERLSLQFRINFPQVLILVLFGFPVLFWGQFAILIISGIVAGWLLFAYKAHLKRVLLVGGTFILLLGGWILWSLPDPNALPMYPNAEDVQSEEIFGTWRQSTTKVISFQTQDTFEEVLDYYESQLSKEGWRFQSRTQDYLSVHSPGEKYFLRVGKHHTGRIRIELQYSLIP